MNWKSMTVYLLAASGFLFGTEKYSHLIQSTMRWDVMLGAFLIINVGIVFMDIMMRKALTKLWDGLYLMTSTSLRVLFIYILPFVVFHFFLNWVERRYMNDYHSYLRSINASMVLIQTREQLLRLMEPNATLEMINRWFG